MGQDTTARVIVQNLKEIFRKSVKTVSVTAGCAKSVRNKTGGADVKDIIFDYMACGDVIRRYKKKKD